MPSKPRKPAEPVHGSVLVLLIGKTAYHLERLQPGAGVRRAWKLTKKNGDQYVVQESNSGYVSCECRDFEYRKAGSGNLCKHAFEVYEQRKKGLLA